MKLIASAKYMQAQSAIRTIHHYQVNLLDLFEKLFVGREDIDFVFTTQREVKCVALVPFSSDTGLCGAYNSNVFKAAEQFIEREQQEGKEVVLFPVGEKVAHSLSKAGFSTRQEGRFLLDKASMGKCVGFAQVLMNAFKEGEVDQVVFLYHHLKSATRQVLGEEIMLPYQLPKPEPGLTPQDIMTEPSVIPFLHRIFPQVFSTRLYHAVSESLVSEYAARMTAMQIATDNANDLLRELTILYNKTRQQAITSEILDLVGGRIRRGN
jgi:F-type H+-transporting ATPase subunit gamma